MKKCFESLTLFEFQQGFPDDQTCMKYLAESKWPGGFACEKYGHTRYCKVKLPQTGQCASCGYQDTPASSTLFHKVKFPLFKAIYIVYFMSTNRKETYSTTSFKGLLSTL